MKLACDAPGFVSGCYDVATLAAARWGRLGHQRCVRPVLVKSRRHARTDHLPIEARRYCCCVRRAVGAADHIGPMVEGAEVTKLRTRAFNLGYALCGVQSPNFAELEPDCRCLDVLVASVQRCDVQALDDGGQLVAFEELDSLVRREPLAIALAALAPVVAESSARHHRPRAVRGDPIPRSAQITNLIGRC